LFDLDKDDYNQNILYLGKEGSMTFCETNVSMMFCENNVSMMFYSMVNIM